MEVRGQPQILAALPPVEEPQLPLSRRLDGIGYRKTSCPCSESNHNSSVSQYTDYTIPAPKIFVKVSFPYYQAKSQNQTDHILFHKNMIKMTNIQCNNVVLQYRLVTAELSMIYQKMSRVNYLLPISGAKIVHNL
jgi:hypothetical protein